MLAAAGVCWLVGDSYLPCSMLHGFPSSRGLVLLAPLERGAGKGRQTGASGGVGTAKRAVRFMDLFTWTLVSLKMLLNA